MYVVSRFKLSLYQFHILTTSMPIHNLNCQDAKLPIPQLNYHYANPYWHLPSMSFPNLDYHYANPIFVTSSMPIHDLNYQCAKLPIPKLNYQYANSYCQLPCMSFQDLNLFVIPYVKLPESRFVIFELPESRFVFWISSMLFRDYILHYKFKNWNYNYEIYFQLTTNLKLSFWSHKNPEVTILKLHFSSFDSSQPIFSGNSQTVIMLQLHFWNCSSYVTQFLRWNKLK